MIDSSGARGGCVVWLTGLPSAGKSTIAEALEAVLARRGARVQRLDGDEIRTNLSRGLGFSRDDRDEQVRRVGYVAGLLERHGVVAISALVSPYREARDAVRASAENFVEVYVKCSLEECIRRDVKGLYRRARGGEIANFTGISDPYEPPLHPEVVVETDRERLDDSVKKILDVLAGKGCVHG